MNTDMETRQAVLLHRIGELVCDMSGIGMDEMEPGDTFLELGFDSLFLTQLAGVFQREFAVPIVFRQLLGELNTIGKLMNYLDSALPQDQWQPVSEDEPVETLPGSNQQPEFVQMAAQPVAMSAQMPMDAGDGSLQQLFAQQLQLIQQQLEFLGGGVTNVAAPAPQAAAAPVAAANEAARAPSAESSTAAPEKIEIKLPPGFVPQVDEESLAKKVPEHVRVYLDDLIAKYCEKTKTSKSMTQKYRKVHADPRTAAGFNPAWKDLVYPIVTKESSGAYLLDVDDNKYIDLLNGFGPNFLGHSPDYVTEAVKKQLDAGIEIGPQSVLAGEVAELVCELTGLDRATFVNTGSEAVQAAMRLSRTVTGKDDIVVFNYDYHGNFDEVLVKGIGKGQRRRTLPLAPGIPMDAVEHIIVLDYGSDEALETIAEISDTVAAVIVEPVQSRHPETRPKEFIKKLRELTEENEIALVFDEVITGFRTGLGGAQEYYGIQADMATYGKVAGGGLPIGIVAGKSRYMDTFDGGFWQYGDDSFPGAGVTFFAGTFVRHPLAMAAAHASLNWLKSQGPAVYENVYKLTTRLVHRLNRLFEAYDVGIHISHFSSQMYFRIEDKNEYLGLLFYFARLNGVYMLEGFPSYLTVTHTAEDIDQVISVFHDGLESLAKAGVISAAAACSVETFPVTAAQQDIWAASQLSEAASCALNESDTVRLSGELNEEAFREAVSQALDRHQALSLRFSDDGTEQWADRSALPKLQVHDFSELSSEGKNEELERFFRDQSTEVFDLSKGGLIRCNLLRLSNDLHLFTVYAHHIVFDGWSSGVLFNEIARIYSSITEGDDLQLPVPVAYSDYVAGRSAEEHQAVRASDIEFWRERNVAAMKPHNLPLDFDRPKNQTYLGATLRHQYESEVLDNLRQVANNFGVTQQNVMMAAFVMLLARHSGDSTVTIGIPTADQSDFGAEPLVGYGVNLLPVSIDVDKSFAVDKVLSSVLDRVLDAFEHKSVGFSELMREIIPDAKSRPGLELVFNYSTYFGSLDFGSLEAAVYENARSAVLFDMFLNVVEMNDHLYVDLDYSTELFTESTLNSWIAEIGEIIDRLASVETGATVESITFDNIRRAC